MKERRQRVMEDFATEISPLDYVIAERFRSERHPEASVDGDDCWDRDLFEEDE